MEVIQLDDYHTLHLNSSNFDYSVANLLPKEINVFLSNGTVVPNTFTKLTNETVVILNIGERSDCSTSECVLNCKPISSLLSEEIVTTFLAANPKNKIQTNCYFACSCDLKWVYDSWKDVESLVGIWIQEYFGTKFYCVPTGASLETDDNFFGVDVSQFNYGDYFKENC